MAKTGNRIEARMKFIKVSFLSEMLARADLFFLDLCKIVSQQNTHRQSLARRAASSAIEAKREKGVHYRDREAQRKLNK